jgi:hypothetical protein
VRESESKGENSEDGSFTRELTDDERSRSRFIRSWKASSQWERFGPRWGPAISLAFAVMPKEVKVAVDKVFDEIGVNRVNNETILAKMFKEMSGVFKKHGDRLNAHWKWFINWETLGGYRDSQDISDFVDELRNWVSGDITHTSLGEDGWSEEQFLDDLELGMEEFLSDLPNLENANKESLSILEWASSPGNWAKSGSSAIKTSLRFYDEKGKLRKPKKTKWRTALTMDPNWVIGVLRTKDESRLKQRNKAIQKRETGKVRAVVNADDETYLRMAYISDWLETALQGSAKSTLYMSKVQMVDMWIKLANATEGNTVKIPLDQSHFDWQQNKRMISRFIKVVRRIISRCAKHKSDLLEVLDGVEKGLVQIEGELNVGTGSSRSVLPIQKGVMSGWRWTALMDTVFNWGELFAARKLVQRWGARDPVLNAIAQGDDDQVACPGWADAALLATAYDSMGFEVNPGKFFVAQNRDEYLRQVAEPGVVSGYPVRSLNSLLWRNPVSRDPVAGLLRAREQVNSWNMLIGRGGDKDATLRLMMRDVSAGNGLSLDQVRRLLGTPACVGGLGLWPAQDWLSIDEGHTTTKVSFDPSSASGLRLELPKWEAAGLGWTKHEALRALGDNLEVNKVPKEVTPGSVYEPQKVSPYPWSWGGGGGVALGARMDPKLPRTLGTPSLDRAIRLRMWDWIESVWLDPDLRGISGTIRQRGGRRVWVDWLQGKLPYKVPNVIGFSAMQISVLFDAASKAAWSRLVTKWKFNYTTVLRSALTVECVVRDACRHASIRLGG